MEIKSVNFRPENESYEEYIERINVESCGLGLFRIEEEAYHKSIGMSRSSLVHMLRSPQYYQFKKSEQTEPSKAMLFGSAVHKAFLEPELFVKEYAVAPKVDKRTTRGKEAWASFEHENKGKKLIDQEDFKDIHSMMLALKKHSYVSKLLGLIKKENIEVSAYTTIEEVLCKSRADMMIPEMGMLIDLKTTQDARPHEFQRSVADYMYHVQAAYYLDIFSKATGITFDKFLFICVEKEAPFGVQVYVADPEMIEVGRFEYQNALISYKQCLEKNEWPSYDEKVLNLALPTWALNKIK